MIFANLLFLLPSRRGAKLFLNSGAAPSLTPTIEQKYLLESNIIWVILNKKPMFDFPFLALFGYFAIVSNHPNWYETMFPCFLLILSTVYRAREATWRMFLRFTLAWIRRGSPASPLLGRSLLFITLSITTALAVSQIWHEEPHLQIVTTSQKHFSLIFSFCPKERQRGCR